MQFVEFEALGVDLVTTLWRDTRVEYDRLRERGRRYYFHGGEYAVALRDLVDESYVEAQAAAQNGSYRSAVTLLGASLEGHLLLRCLRSARRARVVATELPSKLRSHAKAEIRRWSFEVLVEVCDRAGWLRVVESEKQVYFPGGMAHSVRQMRNWVHPAREASERPWQSVYKLDYELAHSLHTVVLASLRGRNHRRTGARDNATRDVGA